MLKNIVKKLVGDPMERAVGKYRETVEDINALEPQMQKCSDAELRAKTDEFRQRLADGATLDDVLVQAFAVVREASRRTTGLRHFDEQLIGVQHSASRRGDNLLDWHGARPFRARDHTLRPERDQCRCSVSGR